MRSSAPQHGESFDALVIGAGLSGLAAGIRLAMSGQRVAILEQHYLWGGLNSFYKRAGRLFDTGLHALTNYTPPKGAPKTSPLPRVLRQLRIKHSDLELGEQRHSLILSAGECVKFSNDVELLIDEIGRLFPSKRDAFAQLVAEIDGLTFGEAPGPERSARALLDERFGEPLITDLLLLPTCYYGSAEPDDVPWGQFTILFKSIFIEGLAMPKNGIRPILDLLLKRLEDEGGLLCLKHPVDAVLTDASGACAGVRVADGRELYAPRVLSSAGWLETLGLVDRDEVAPDVAHEGRLSFLETIVVTDAPPMKIDARLDAATAFFSDRERFEYREPTADRADPLTGVISMPNNYAGKGDEPEGWFRVTIPASFPAFQGLDEDFYVAEKQRLSEASMDTAVRLLGADVRPREIQRDIFTPRTLEHYTKKRNGAIYGSPNKQLDGTTPVPGLHLIGTDQGFLGVVGAALSGISIANQFALSAR